jgi:hypothetical protein
MLYGQDSRPGSSLPGFCSKTGYPPRTDLRCLLVGLVFAGMTGIWCIAAIWLTNHRALGAPIRYFANRLVPFLLIGLGLLILIKSGAAQVPKEHLLKPG